MIPETPSIVLQWRELLPEDVLADMTEEAAVTIVQDWEAAKEERVIAVSSRADYLKIVRNLRKRWAKQLGQTVLEALKPAQMVDLVFEKSRSLSESSWTKYRSSLLYFLKEALEDHRDQGVAGTDYLIALAILIVVNRPPHPDERLFPQPPKRRTGVPEADALDLFDDLFVSTVNRAQEARLYAMATLMTGLRPGEWKDVDITESDYGDETDPAFFLYVSTSKQKGDQERPRTLVLETIEARNLVRDQIDMIGREIKSDDWTTTHPVDNLHKKCSSIIKEASKRLWPTDQSRWYTLYDFRHQARANFAARFDEWTAAAMLGHGYEVSRKHYAPRRRGWKSGQMMGIGPGQDVVERAAQMRIQYPMRQIVERPWQPSVAGGEDDMQMESLSEVP